MTRCNLYRAIPLPNTHLGTRGCKARYLLQFLRHDDSDTLDPVGDITDSWGLKRGCFGPRTHNDVVRKVLPKVHKGTRVVCVPANHDEFGRPFAGLDSPGIAIRAHAEHRLLNGRRPWAVHRDLADGVIRHARWLAHVGDRADDIALWLNRHFNALRARLGHDDRSQSQYLQHKVRNAAASSGSFEQVLMREAGRHGFDGMIGGHIHHAEIRGSDGLVDCYDGDRVVSLTALVQTYEASGASCAGTGSRHQADPCRNGTGPKAATAFAAPFVAV